MSDLLDVALAYRQADRSILPIAPGEKRPSVINTQGEVVGIPWEAYQITSADEATIRAWFPSDRLMGIGIVCGPVSGIQRDGVPYGLEILDVDDEQTLDAFIEAANWQGLSELLERLLFQRTPGGAGHFAFVCKEWAGNTKLAQRQDGVDEKGKPQVKTLIETRGEGGQAVVAPTPPGIHPEHSERGYELVRGSWEALPMISPAERHALLALARSFNEYVEPAQVHTARGAGRPRPSGNRPGDWLNRTADAAWWRALLERHDWSLVRERNGMQYWCRPGKDVTRAWSATLGACGPYFYVFSSNASPFQPEHAYAPFSAVALLDHGGDFQTAARTLIPQRFAAEWPGMSAVVVPLLEQLHVCPEARLVFDALAALKGLDRAAWGATKHAIKGLLGDTIDLTTLQAAWRKVHTPGGLAPMPLEEGPETAEPPDTPERIPYRATQCGLVWLKETKDGPVQVSLANFTARITADVVLDDGAETQHQFEIEARHRGQVTRFTVPASGFSGMAWVTEQLGAQAILMPGMTLKDHARAAVQLLSADVQARHVYTHFGWRKIGDEWVYLHAGGAIGQGGQGSEGIEVNVSNDLQRYVLETPASPAAHVGAVRASMQVLEVAPLTLTLPLYASIWRAVLGDASLSLFLVGRTGIGKTALAALIQQHFGAAMDARRLPATWESSGNALEALAFAAKDAVLVVDEHTPTEHVQAQVLHRTTERLLRGQANRTGRQRMRADTTLRPAKPPWGLIVATGEDMLKGQSLRARVVILEVTPHAVDFGKLTPCQTDAASGVYTQALAGFVQWLAPQYSAVQGRLSQELMALREQALQSGMHRRTPENVASLTLGWCYFLRFAEEMGALTGAEAQQWAEDGWRILGTVARMQGQFLEQAEPTQRFLGLLTEAMARGKAHVAAPAGQAPPSPHA